MTGLLDLTASNLASPTSRLPLCLVAGAASLGIWISLRSLRSSLESDRPHVTPSPGETVLPQLSQDEVKRLPYPPNALPGARDVRSPYGSTHLYEWGAEEGEKILLIHGISTPSIALVDLAHKLVEKGCRVMLFDLFGRGYSSGPSSTAHRYDSSLYASQILICLQSSPIPWSQFTLIGYSLGGAVAADFASYFPRSVQGLVLVASGGLIRTKHITWKSKFLYSSGGLLPEPLIECLVAKRLWTGPESARTVEPEPDTAAAETRGGIRSHAVYRSSSLGLLPGNLNSTVSNVVDWQILHHQGFVSAFISSIRYAPIHNQHHRWSVLALHLKGETYPLNQVHFVLGETDPIIIADELIEDAKDVLGGDYVTFKVVKGAGHEVAIERADEIVSVVGKALEKEGW